MTEKCALVGAAINASLTQAASAAVAVDKCHSFYDHACGKNEKPDDVGDSTFSKEFSPLLNAVLEDLYQMTADVLSQPISPVATEGEKVAKILFGTCKATNTIYDTLPALQEMHTLFAALGFNINLTSPLTIEDMQLTSLEHYDDGPLFSVRRVPVFDGNKFTYLPQISPPRLVLKPSLYDPSSQSIRVIQETEKAYLMTLRNILFSFFTLNLRGSSPPPDLNEKIEARMWDVLNFEKQLKQILPDDTADWTRLNAETMTVGRVEQFTPSLSWASMLNKRSADRVRVYYKDYLETLDILLQRSEDDVVKTYIFYHVLFRKGWPLVPRSLREVMMTFLEVDVPLDYSDTGCAKITFDVAFPDAVQLLKSNAVETFMVEENFSEELVHNLTVTLDSVLTDLGWLTELTRNFLASKMSLLATSGPELGVRKETVNPEFRSNVSATQSFLSNALQRRRSLVAMERTLDERKVDRPDEVRLQFSPLYSVDTDTLYLPLAFIHLGTWLKDSAELLPLYQYIAARSILSGLLHPETRNSWTDPSVLSLQERITCMSDNVTPTLSSNVDPDHLTNLITAAATLQLINKDETSASKEQLTLGSNTFADKKQFRFYLLAQAYCSGDVFKELGELAPGKPKAEVELNFAIANDNLFGMAFGCEPGLPMAGISTCSLWDEDSFFDYNS
ncbi:uncharacterized protein LOC143299356 [Babylonia areolata]|uniref:uncharacterized protein LOC143299356 n=1 Tax=Babylonia areolata TaxID=304850 RepID=UPI003FD4BD12